VGKGLIMGNLDIYEKVRSVPIEAQKEIGAGRLKGFTDINPMFRIKSLTEIFGVCGFGWYYKVIKQWLETNENQVFCFVDIELFLKLDGEWSMPVYGTGGSKFVTKESTQFYASDECYKMATTDALSVACKQLGIGADIYWSRDVTKYTQTDDAKSKETKATESKQPPVQDSEKATGISEHDRLIGIFHQEIKRTGKSLKFFLTEAKVSDAKYIKSELLTAFIDRLKQYPTKE